MTAAATACGGAAAARSTVGFESGTVRDGRRSGGESGRLVKKAARQAGVVALAAQVQQRPSGDALAGGVSEAQRFGAW